MTNTTTTERQGWTASPDGRGTMSIIWSCGITTFLCCWSVLIVNVPAPDSGFWSVIARKFLLLLLCATAPEAIFQVALGQWLSARESVKVFKASEFEGWSLRHGFFVNMGGFHLKSPGLDPFPINSPQLHYLIEQKHVSLAQIKEVKENQIRDRNKVDGVLRLITLVQTLFFVINLMIRIFQKLDITALELSTLALVVMSMATTIFWFQKPADVQERICLQTDTPIATMVEDFGLTPGVGSTYTPLDFIGRQEWSWSILWMHGLNSLRIFHLGGQSVEFPNNRFHNTTIPLIEGWPHAFLAVLSLAYLGIFVAGWNFNFPTPIEQTLWRSASLTAMISASGVFITCQMFFKYFPSDHGEQIPVRSSTAHVASSQDDNHQRKRLFSRLRAAYDFIISYLRNNSANKDPALDAPARAVLLTGVFGFFYVVARIYIFAADLIELRSLPTDAYETLDWASLAPYIP